MDVRIAPARVANRQGSEMNRSGSEAVLSSKPNKITQELQSICWNF
jgi:hypothetical protein